MALEMLWYIDQRVVYSRLYGEVTEEDLIQQGEQIQNYIEQGIRPMFFIVNALNVAKHPANIKDVIEAMGKNRPQSGDIQWTIIVTESRLINFLGSVVSNVFKITVRTCKTLDEAEAFVAYHAPDLAPALEARKLSEKTDSVAS